VKELVIDVFIVMVVVFVYDEVEVLSLFVEWLCLVLDDLGEIYEVFVVDDGSIDVILVLFEWIWCEWLVVCVVWLRVNSGY